MRYPASEKLEIIQLVEQSHLPVRRTLEKLGIPRPTFYRWYDRYRTGGPEALEALGLDGVKVADRPRLLSDNVLRAESALESSHDVSDCKIAPAASFWSTQIRDKPKARRLPRVMEKISSIANTGSRKRLALTVLNTSF